MTQFLVKIYFSFITVLKCKEKGASTNFPLLPRTFISFIDFFTETSQDSTISFTWENPKMFNITSKYFSIFNNKSPAS